MDVGVLHSVVGEVWTPIKGFSNYVVWKYGKKLFIQLSYACI